MAAGGARKRINWVAAICASLLAVPAVSQRAHNAPGYAASKVEWAQNRQAVTLQNGFIEITFDALSHRITHLSADHQGKGKFQKELLGGAGIWLQGDYGGKAATIREHNTSSCLALSAEWQTSAETSPGASLSFSLCPGDRGIRAEALLPKGSNLSGVQFAFRQWFQLAAFQRGVVQYVSGQRQTFTSKDALQLFYTIDRENGSVAVVPDAAMPPEEVALLSGVGEENSGLVLSARAAASNPDVWRAGLQSALADPSDAEHHVAFKLYANDLPYPAHRDDSRLDRVDGERAKELTAYFTAIYASSAGVLGSFADAGSAYPTLAHPVRAYGDLFDFFDPDSWEVVTALSYSGDPILQHEARSVLDRAGASQSPNGQIPHHFDPTGPTFLSIAGSSQTGPNIFWVTAAMEYVNATGDESWLRDNYSKLRSATDWLTARFDPERKLVHADGPLFIDVFRRSGYTLDTNVFTYELLGRIARVAEFMGDQDTAARYRAMKKDIGQGLLHELWDGHDHFLTERHEDGSTRDFVDYDGNLGAVAFDVPQTRIDTQRLLARLDQGLHIHPGGYGTWVSERRYEKSDCYKNNDGDSDVTMARIWWLDLIARARTGNRTMFNAQLGKVQRDLLQNVWLPERYDADGNAAHNSHYHEYPEVYAAALRELRYGVSVDLQSVTIHPFGISSFNLPLGRLQISFSQQEISLLIPGTGQRSYNIAGVSPGRRYAISTGGTLTADAGGQIHFVAPSGSQIKLKRLQ